MNFPYSSVDQICKDIETNGNEIYENDEYKILIEEICIFPKNKYIYLKGREFKINNVFKVKDGYPIEQRYSINYLYEKNFKFVATGRSFGKEIGRE